MTLIGNIGNLARRVSDALDAVIAILGLDIVTGFLRTEYDDVFPGNDWAVPSGASAPDIVTVNIAGVNYVMRAFDGGNTTETMTNSFEITHKLDVVKLNAGTIKPEFHVHCRPSTTGAGVVVWQMTAVHSKPDTEPVSMGTIRCPVTFVANQRYWHKLAGVEFNTPAAGFTIGDTIEFNLFRNPQDSEDTYTGDALMSQCALHMPNNGRGSRQRYIK